MAAMGQRLQKDETVFSSWFPRGADYAVFRAQLIDRLDTDSDLTIEIFHKNTEDAGNGGQVGSFSLLWNAGEANGTVKSVDVTDGMKELVRFKYQCTSSSSTGWFRFQMLQPTWYDAAKA